MQSELYRADAEDHRAVEALFEPTPSLVEPESSQEPASAPFVVPVPPDDPPGMPDAFRAPEASGDRSVEAHAPAPEPDDVLDPPSTHTGSCPACGSPAEEQTRMRGLLSLLGSIAVMVYAVVALPCIVAVALCAAEYISGGWSAVHNLLPGK